MLDKYQVTDKSKAGIYVMTTAEARCFEYEAENGATNKWIKTKVDDAGDKLVDQFVC